MDLSSWDWYGGFVEKTYRELSSETGLSLELLQAIRESMGSARPEPEDAVHEEELDFIPVVRVALDAGADALAIERLVRVWGESMRRITEAAATFSHAQIEVPLLRSGMNEAQVLQVANEAVAAGIPYLDQAIVSMYHGHSEHTWLANVVEAVEATLEKAGLHHTVAEPPAMCFLDISDCTRLTEERGTRSPPRSRLPSDNWSKRALRATDVERSNGWATGRFSISRNPRRPSPPRWSWPMECLLPAFRPPIRVSIPSR